MTILQVDGLAVAYGPIQAVVDVSFSVDEGEVVALIGANGAGKTTTLAAISGLLPRRAGSIRLGDQDLSRMRPHQIVSAGVVQVPEGREIFARMTVEENLEVGAWARHDASAVRREMRLLMERFPILGQRRKQRAAVLSGGEQQILAVARALLSAPRLLLMDEPTLGLAPRLVDEIFAIIKSIHDAGQTVLLVEQNALRALECADRGYVMETGRTTLTGTGPELARNEAVRRAYLGV